MKVGDKEKLNNPMKGWLFLNAISIMVFCTVQCVTCHMEVELGDGGCVLNKDTLSS